MPSSRARLTFTYTFGEREAFEAEARGYCGYAVAELADGAAIPVVFYDAVRLRQDLETMTEHGRPFIAEPCLIVVASVTLENMELAIERLAEEGFFEPFRNLRSPDAP